MSELCNCNKTRSQSPSEGEALSSEARILEAPWSEARLSACGRLGDYTALLIMCEETKVTMQRHMQNLRHSKEELNSLNQAIQQLTVEVDSAKSRPCKLEGAKHPPALQEESASGSAKGKLASLEAALQRAKQDMVRQLQEYQELMIVKLGLDFEIATYRKLLEDEQSRLGLRLGAGNLTQGSNPTGGPGSTLGSARLLPSRASSDTLDMSAPGDGCSLCSSSGCVGDFSGRGFRGC